MLKIPTEHCLITRFCLGHIGFLDRLFVEHIYVKLGRGKIKPAHQPCSAPSNPWNFGSRRQLGGRDEKLHRRVVNRWFLSVLIRRKPKLALNPSQRWRISLRLNSWNTLNTNRSLGGVRRFRWAWRSWERTMWQRYSRGGREIRECRWHLIGRRPTPSARRTVDGCHYESSDLNLFTHTANFHVYLVKF